MIGETFGNYEVLAAIGKGGMGEVFLAQHQRIARRAAIKVLSPELTRYPDAVKRFLTEARATSLIRHPGIVEVLDCGIDARARAYIVMEYLEGETLAAYLKRAGRLPWRLACAIGRQIADAVGAAHGSGIVHRDLKPENVFLWAGDPGAAAPGVAVKVLDFGIAKLLSFEARAERITRDGVMLGTPRYTSPEQFFGASEVDQRTDVYSLGCIVFEMICGAPPFVIDRLQALMAAHMFEPPPAASAAVPAIPAWLDQLLARMLAKTPEERPASMVEVAGLLAAAGEAAPHSGPSARAVTRQRAVTIRAAALAVAAGGVAVGLLLATWPSPRAHPLPKGPASLAAELEPHAPAGARAGIAAAVMAMEPARDAAVPIAPAAPPAPVIDAAASQRRRNGPPGTPLKMGTRLKRQEKDRARPAAASEEADGIVDL